MLRNSASIYSGLPTSHSLVLFCGMPIGDVEGVRRDPSIPLSRAFSEMSPTHLVLVLYGKVCLFPKSVMYVCFVGKFCLSVFSGVSMKMLSISLQNCVSLFRWKVLSMFSSVASMQLG